MKKILVADDEADIRNLEKDLLESHGYKVLTATNGKETLDLVANDRPDLVLLDIMMPGMHGHYICEKIKTDDALKDIKVIIITASAAPLDFNLAKYAHADLYIVKPFEVAALLKCVKALLDD